MQLRASFQVCVLWALWAFLPLKRSVQNKFDKDTQCLHVEAGRCESSYALPPVLYAGVVGASVESFGTGLRSERACSLRPALLAGLRAGALAAPEVNGGLQIG